MPGLLAEDVIIAVDSTPIRVANQGEWMREKWKVRRGWLNVPAMIGVGTNWILGLKITGESVRGDRMFVPLLDLVWQHCGEGCPVHRVIADGAYDRSEYFNAFEKWNISSGSRLGPTLRPALLGHRIGLNASENELTAGGIGCGRW